MKQLPLSPLRRGDTNQRIRQEDSHSTK